MVVLHEIGVDTRVLEALRIVDLTEEATIIPKSGWCHQLDFRNGKSFYLE